MTFPFGVVVDRTSSNRRSWSLPRKRRLPDPSTMGEMMSASSSTRSYAISVWTSSPLPRIEIVPPGPSFSFGTASAASPSSSVAFSHERSSERPGSDVLPRRVQMAGERIIARLVGPVSGHDLVGPSPEQIRVRLGHPLLRIREHTLVEVRRLPAAVLEAAFGVLLRRPRSLHDPVKGQELGDHQLAHLLSRGLPVATLRPSVLHGSDHPRDHD